MISIHVITKRLAKFREKLKEKEIEAAFISKRENYVYLSGFTGSSAYLIISQEDAILVTDSRYEEQAGKQAVCFDIVRNSGILINTLNEILKDKKISCLGFEEEFITYKEYLHYKSGLVIKNFVPIGNILESLRMVKTDDEVEIIAKAVEIADDAFNHIITFIKPGIKEIEIAAELEYHMKKLGAKSASFETIVASGQRSSMPHGVASDKVVCLGDTVTLDYGAIYNDYCSDMTRTVFVGNPREEIKKIYKIVLEAQLKSLEGSKSGVLTKDVDGIARDIIKKSGFEKNFGHGLGHGVGLEIHEQPRLNPAGSIVLEKGMVVTVEPGIYIPGLGGVRIEDMIVIQDDKPRILTKSTKELVII